MHHKTYENSEVSDIYFEQTTFTPPCNKLKNFLICVRVHNLIKTSICKRYHYLQAENEHIWSKISVNVASL